MSVLTSAYSGLGITLSYKIGAGSYVNVAQLMDDCEFDGFDTNIIPVPLLASTSVPKVPGRTDYGTFTGTLFLVPGDTGVAEFFTLSASKATVSWQLQLPDGTSSTTGTAYTFPGFVSNIKPGGFSGESATTLGFTIAISGAVTTVAGS